jgi:hypothetical protein
MGLIYGSYKILQGLGVQSENKLFGFLESDNMEIEKGRI